MEPGLTRDDGWAEPGAHPVAEGVYRIPLPLPSDGLRAVNVYVHESSGGLLAIDGGWALAASRDALDRALGAIGHSVRSIHTFVVTHHHRDHYTQAVAVRREFGARVMIGADERWSLRRARTVLGRLGATQLELLSRAGAPEVADELHAAGYGTDEGHTRNLEDPDVWLDEGAVFPTDAGELHSLRTPGHTRGHLSYVDADRALFFAGDHVLPHITPSIGFEASPSAMPLKDYLASLRKVRALPDQKLLPAHGGPLPSTHRRVDELLEHHRARLEACLDAVGSSATAVQVARLLPWTSRGHRFDGLDVFNRMLAASETLAHLDVLVDEGRLAVEHSPDGVATYCAIG